MQSSQSQPISLTLDKLSFNVNIISTNDLTYTQKDKIGEGSFGVVYQGKWKHGDKVAIKQLQGELDEKGILEFKKEAALMAQLNSPFIIRLFGICIDQDRYALVMELMPNKSLYHFLHSDKEIPWKLRYEIARDIGYGLRLLHERNIIHRDLKSLNVLMDEHYRAKISDFGMSTVKTQSSGTSTKGKGTMRWMAPELVEGKANTKASDMFSYGTILSELTTRKIPFDEIVDNMLVGMQLWQGKTPILDEATPAAFAALIKPLWTLAADKRPHIDKTVEELEAIIENENKIEEKIIIEKTSTPIANINVNSAEKPTYQSKECYSEATYKSKENQSKANYQSKLTTEPSYAESLYQSQITQSEKKNVNDVSSAKESSSSLSQEFYEKGMKYYDSKEFQEAFNYFLKAAKDGHIDSQCQLAVCYQAGRGVAKDEKLSFYWYQKAAEQEYSAAQYILGSRYLDGRGVPKDEKSAFYWFQKAAEQEDSDAQYNLGLCYEHGKGVEKNIQVAIEWYQKAVKLDDKRAQNKLAFYCENREDAKKEKQLINLNQEAALILDPLNLNQEAILILDPLRAWSISNDKDLGKLHHQQGLEFCKKGQYQEALLSFEEAAKAGWPAAYVRLGWLYAKSGRLGPINKKRSDAWYKNISFYIEWFEKQAKTKEAEAIYNLGVCYFYGFGVLQDQTTALNLFLDSALQSYPDAQFFLGEAQEKGEGIDKNEEQARLWFQKAAEQEHADAQAKLAYYYDSGKGGLKIDKRKAIELYQKAAEQNVAHAQYQIGIWQLQGNFLNLDKKQGFISLQKAAEKGHAGGQCALGICYKNGSGIGKNDEEAIKWFQRAAEQDQGTAQVELAQCYLYGKGVEKDYFKAFTWYEKAAHKGIVDAQFSLATCYEKGHGVKRDLVKAAKWFEKAANKGHLVAQQELGNFYMNGDGVTKNETQAEIWLLKAEKQGSSEAQFKLGILYSTADHKKTSESVWQNNKLIEVIKKDDRVAEMWFKKAVNNGHIKAHLKLGELYCFGGQGIEKNEKLAYSLFQKAAANNDSDAQYYLGCSYETGMGVACDVKLANEWYQKAANQDHIKAIIALKKLENSISFKMNSFFSKFNSDIDDEKKNNLRCRRNS